jgi:hypothetical protein
MPELTTYPFDAPSVLDEAAASEFAARREAIELAWRYYRREHRKPLKVRPGQIDDNVLVNMAREVVDQSVGMLFGLAPVIELDEVETTDAELALRRVFESNGEAIFLQNMATQGGLAGHVFIKLTPDAALGVRFVRLNPRNVTVFWSPDDYESVTCYRIQYGDKDAQTRQDIVPLSATWLTRDFRKERDGNWMLLAETEWPWPWPPIVDWQNLPDPEAYYGEGDLLNAALNDTANFVASNNNRIIKFHGHPKTIGVGVRADEIKETAVDGFWAIPNQQANVFNLEMKGDLAAAMGFLEFIQGAFYSEHRTVNLASMKDRLGQMTNFGLRVLFKGATDKLTQKRALYGAGLVEISRRTLLLLGMGEHRPRVAWPDPLLLNRLEMLEGLAKERDLGIVSQATAAADAGRDWDVEQDRLEAEKAGQENVGSMILRAFETGQDVPG